MVRTVCRGAVTWSLPLPQPRTCVLAAERSTAGVSTKRCLPVYENGWQTEQISIMDVALVGQTGLKVVPAGVPRGVVGMNLFLGHLARQPFLECFSPHCRGIWRKSP